MEKYNFEWVEGNKHKSVLKHGITNIEAESVFCDSKLKIFFDTKHSHFENIYICIGKSGLKRIIVTAFTIRNEKYRIISSRIANKKLNLLYESTSVK
jgi:hypothetical protein